MAAPPPTARHAAVDAIRILRGAGHVAYLAGGCVRDALLGMEPKDYDIATDATPDRVRALFRRSRYVGEAFGVCLVFVGRHAIEVATFRSEWGYRDGRRPDHVIFTDAEHDARRRDFTINGLFADPLAPPASDAPEPAADLGRIIDYVDGVADLRAGIVRAIGEPDQRFGEDYLRMLRAVRFAARLGFAIEPRTAAAIRSMARYLGQISRERIGAEVAIMFTGPQADPPRAVQQMQTLRLDGPVLQEDHRDAPTHVLDALDPAAAYGTGLAAWMIDRSLEPPARGMTLRQVSAFIDTAAGRTVERWRAALSLSNADRDALRGVLRLTARAAKWGDLPVAGRKRLLAEPLWPQAHRLLRAIGDAAALAAIDRDAAPLLEQGVAPPPLIRGDELIALGLEPGPAFGKLLDQVYDAQLEGKIATRDDAVAWIRRQITPV